MLRLISSRRPASQCVQSPASTQLFQDLHLVGVADVEGGVLDLGHFPWLRGDRHCHRLVQVLGCRLLHPRRNGRGEERRLAVRRSAGDDALHIRGKTAVKHLVRFVQHQEAHAVEPERALVEQVEHTARRADHDVDATPQFISLRAKGAPTGDHQRLDAARGAKCLNNLGHLDGKLARRGQHQGLHGLETRINNFDQGQGKRKGFA